MTVLSPVNFSSVGKKLMIIPEMRRICDFQFKRNAWLKNTTLKLRIVNLLLTTKKFRKYFDGVLLYWIKKEEAEIL